MGFGKAVVNISAEGMQRHSSFAGPFTPGDLGAIQAARHLNLDPERSQPHSVGDRAFHRPAEHNPPLQLLGYTLSDQLRIQLWLPNFLDVDLEILDLLNTLFSLSTSSETKKKRLQKDFGIAMTEEFESEVQDMCNLGKALVEQGIEQGVEKKNLSLAKMMIKDKESLDKIEKYTGFSADKLKEIAASIGTNLTA